MRKPELHGRELPSVCSEAVAALVGEDGAGPAASHSGGSGALGAPAAGALIFFEVTANESGGRDPVKNRKLSELFQNQENEP